MVEPQGQAAKGGGDPRPETLTVAVRHRFRDERAPVLDARLSSSARTIALLGSSGAGKTTLLHIVAGLLRPASATVSVRGRLLARTDQGLWLPPEQRNIGYVTQDPLLFPLHTVRGNLLFGRSRARGLLDVDDVVGRLGLSSLLDRRPRYLSGGERQRVALGRALLSEPDLLLCDEPVSALDDVARDALLDLIDGCSRDLHIPVLLVTHRIAEARRIGEELYELRDGAVLRRE